MTIATNCSSTRNRINFWERFGDPPRIMFRRPSKSTSATAPTAMGRMIVLRKDAIGARYHPIGHGANVLRKGADAGNFEMG